MSVYFHVIKERNKYCSEEKSILNDGSGQLGILFMNGSQTSKRSTGYETLVLTTDQSD